MSLIAAVIVALAAGAADAPKPIESDHAVARLLGQPCMGFQFLSGTSVYNAAHDKELFVVSSASEGLPMSLIFTDIAEQKSTAERAPSGAGVVVSGSAHLGARSLPTEHVASRGVTAAARMSRVA